MTEAKKPASRTRKTAAERENDKLKKRLAELEAQLGNEQEEVKPEPKKRQPRTKARIVRNLHNSPVHIRFVNAVSEKTQKVQLQPRGFLGDVQIIPESYTDDINFQKNVDNLFEIITQTEFDAIEYPPVGYNGGYREQVTVFRQEDNTIFRGEHSEGVDKRFGPGGRIMQNDKPVTSRKIGPNYVHAPGADPNFTEQQNPGAGSINRGAKRVSQQDQATAEGALPPDAFPKGPVKIVKGD